MADMYYKLVIGGKRQMTSGGPLPQVPEMYLAEVQAMLDNPVVS